MLKKVVFENSQGAEFMYCPAYAEVLPLDLKAEDFFLNNRPKTKKLIQKAYFPSKRQAKKFLYNVCRASKYQMQ